MVNVTILEATMVEITMLFVHRCKCKDINLPVYERLIRKCKSERSEVKTQLPPVTFLSFQKELERRHQAGLHLLPSRSTMVYEQLVIGKPQSGIWFWWFLLVQQPVEIWKNIIHADA